MKHFYFHLRLRTTGKIILCGILLAGCMIMSGCRKEPAKKPQAGPSTAETMINGVTGHTAVKAGQKARETIDRVKAQQNQDLQDALEP
ncbi:MAG: hypothetical protein A2498_01335 [Lentisphaerae bacterium RIFOXYC12_FULL_60_16]|nr:MAG: hypothetical protein A2498_01335 [Lentisphaerae bacterium RIFOXYC12_FULL_60_16]OGV78322.1 MAG: hypothetical protein A2340_15890 [Lentisphaerae bacterium RIFOXYB12_FULL_60_10]